MTWMFTSGGTVADLRFIDPEAIRLPDIAHALAIAPCFCGHTQRPYSVAEHSLLVVEVMERVLGIRSPSALLAALMHDAHKAYCGDVSLPMKQLLGLAWRTEEDRLQWSVLRRFGVAIAFISHLELIRHADHVAMATERRDLMPGEGPDGPSPAGIQPLPDVNLRARDGAAWGDWKQAFIDRFVELQQMRQRHALQKRPFWGTAFLAEDE